jgi:hypothetical protein
VAEETRCAVKMRVPAENDSTTFHPGWRNGRRLQLSHLEYFHLRLPSEPSDVLRMMLK